MNSSERIYNMIYKKKVEGARVDIIPLCEFNTYEEQLIDFMSSPRNKVRIDFLLGDRPAFLIRDLTFECYKCGKTAFYDKNGNPRKYNIFIVLEGDDVRLYFPSDTGNRKLLRLMSKTTKKKMFQIMVKNQCVPLHPNVQESGYLCTGNIDVGADIIIPILKGDKERAKMILVSLIKTPSFQTGYGHSFINCESCRDCPSCSYPLYLTEHYKNSQRGISREEINICNCDYNCEVCRRPIKLCKCNVCIICNKIITNRDVLIKCECRYRCEACLRWVPNCACNKEEKDRRKAIALETERLERERLERERLERERLEREAVALRIQEDIRLRRLREERESQNRNIRGLE